MECPACQRENRPGRRFCGECGASLEPACAACGARNDPGDRFCGQCGARLGATAAEPAPDAPPTRDPRDYTPRHLIDRILTSRSALEGERKHVTALFADVVGFTPLAEGSDPEDMHALMDRCFQLIAEQVYHYEGTVNQFTGDGVMALFGAPIALEDAPRRAVLAALGLQAALEPLCAEVREGRGREFRMRVGIHSGLVVVGGIGDDLRMDYTAIGDTINLAARLEQLADPGTILISEATEHRVRSFFELRDRGELRVKGKALRVRAFEVLGQRAVEGRLEAAVDAGLTPLVGRDRDLQALRASFDAARAGRGQVTFVVGEAGIGKSRLLYEFRRGLGDEPHTWFEGRCASYARTTAFNAVVDGLRRGFAIEDRDDDAAALARLDAGVAELPGELDWTLPYLRGLLSLPPGDAAVAEMEAIDRRSETIRALHDFFLAQSARSPLIFAIEDLHWIDPASEEFLGFLADSIPAARALLIFTHRPGYQQPFGDRTYHSRLTPQPLSSSEMNAMAGALLETGSLPGDLGALIARKAEGNPLFIEELTKSLLDDGVLRRADGGVEVARALSEVSVPDSIQDLLMSRIDRLADRPKRAIQVASVIGREFALRLLERISEAGDRVSTVVGELRALELIYEKAAHPELAFMFKHALTHDVAYQSVLLQRRRALHRVVGSAIEELYGDRLAEHYEALAHHFALGEDWERALDYHERAADKAADAYANQTAAEHCRQALAIADRLGDGVPDPRRAALEEQLAQLTWTTSDFRESGDAYLRAAERAADPVGEASNLAWGAFSLLWAHDYERASRATDAALSAASEEDAPAAHAVALIARDEQSVVEGGITTGDELAEKGLALAERSGDPSARIMALSQFAQRAEWRGEFRRAVEIGERAIELGRRERLSTVAVFSLWFSGLARCCLGEYALAIARFQESLAVCDRIGDRAFKARLLNSLGWCYAEMGAHRRASEYNQLGTDLGRQMVELDLVAGAPELHANASINLAGNRVALGDPHGALARLEPIQAELERSSDPWMRWRYAMHLQDARARVALAMGDPEGALSWIDGELASARSYAAQKLQARALELRGRTLLTMDRRGEAERALGEALEIAGRIEYPPVVWRAHALLGELGRRRGDRESERHAARARGLIDSLATRLPERDVQREFRGLGERLESDPLDVLR